MDIVFGILAIYFSNDQLWQVAYYCSIAGVCLGWIAVLTGLLDLFVRLSKHGKEATNRALLHAGIQSSVIAGYTILLSTTYKNPIFITSPPMWLWFGKVFLILTMIIGNYIGGELLMKYIAKDFQSGKTNR